MIPEYLAVALQTMRANPLRTLLSTLGVVIGVGALVSILALTDGLEAFSRAEIEATTDLQMVSVSSVTVDRIEGVQLRRASYPVFAPADAAELAARLGESAGVGLVTSYAAFWSPPGDTTQRQLLVTATTPSTLAMQNMQLLAGRALTETDMTSGDAVAVVSPELVALLGVSADEALGRTIEIGRRAHTIVGVAAGGSGQGSRVARAAIALPAPEALPGAVDARPPTLLIRSTRVEDVPEVRAATEAWLAERWDTAGQVFAVSSNVARVAQTERALLVFRLVMAAIAGISLLVGGIGIMNVLLASVTERTREIGIRRASGACQRDIRRQFLAESVAISAVGSGLGVALGMGVSMIALVVVSRITTADVRAVFAWQSVLFAVGAAIVVGLAFGLYPALRAARLSPIEALRHE